jgi:hypothetical protein
MFQKIKILLITRSTAPAAPLCLDDDHLFVNFSFYASLGSRVPIRKILNQRYSQTLGNYFRLTNVLKFRAMLGKFLIISTPKLTGAGRA